MSRVAQSLAASAKPRAWEFGMWALLLALPYFWPTHALLISEITIIALFAMSLDLVLGYSGIVSLGHAAFFGLGGYAAGLLAKHISPDPLTGLLLAAVVSALAGALMSLTVLRGNDLTRLMVTLGLGAGMLMSIARHRGLNA